MLRQHRVDLVLALEPAHEDQVECRHLLADELLFTISPRHAWAIQKRVSREDIPSQNFILYPRSSYTFRLIEQYFARENIAWRSYIELGSMEAIKGLVKLDLGIGILAPWIAREELKEGSLVALPLGKRKLKRNWAILNGQGRRLSLMEETFINLCRAAAARLG